MCCETPPFGHLGVSKRTKWGMINGVTGHQSKVQRRSFGGLEPRNGGWALAKRPKFVQKMKKNNPFCNFQGTKYGIIYWYKTWGKTHSILCITITENTDFQHIALHLTPIPTMTSPPLQQIHYAMGKNLHLQLHSVFSFQFSVSFFCYVNNAQKLTNWFYNIYIIYIIYYIYIITIFLIENEGFWCDSHFINWKLKTENTPQKKMGIPTTHEIYFTPHAYDTLLPRPIKQTAWHSRKFSLATQKNTPTGHQKTWFQ